MISMISMTSGHPGEGVPMFVTAPYGNCVTGQYKGGEGGGGGSKK